MVHHTALAATNAEQVAKNTGATKIQWASRGLRRLGIATNMIFLVQKNYPPS